MKWVDMNLFHGGQYEYTYSHIGMGCHNLEFFAYLYPANSSHLYQPDQWLNTVHRTPNHHWYYPICEPEKQASARHLSSPVSKIPLAAGPVVETPGTDAHQIVLSCRYCMDGYGRYDFSPHRPKGRWRRMVAGHNTLDCLPCRSLLGTEPCGVDPAGKASLGRRAAGTSYQHEIASQKRPRPYRTCPANACGSKGLVSRKAVYDGCGRLLRHTGRLWCGIFSPYQPYAVRCGYLRIAYKKTKPSKRSPSQKRQTTANPNPNSLSDKILVECEDLRTGQNQISAGVCQGGAVVQSFSYPGAAGNKPRSCGQGKGRFFLHDRSEAYACRGDWRFCGAMEHRGYFQEYQTVSGQRRAADVERPRAGTCGGDKPVAVFGGVGVVYPVWLWENQTANYTMVFHQNFSEFPGCVGSIAKGAVAETNYYNVRQSYRTCTNYRVLHRCRSYGCIINYEKCESSLS